MPEATLKHVAERAGVAVATVARVLNGTGPASEATRARVMEAVEATGYRANALARGLKRRRSTLIGHLLRSTLPNPFFVEVARGVEDEARARGYTVLTVNVHGDPEEERQGIETFLGWRVAGLVFTTPVAAGNVAFAQAGGVPVVQVERPLTTQAHRITVRNAHAAAEAMAHLLGLGHRRVAYVGGAPGTQANPLAGYVESERFGAFAAAMGAIGTPAGDLAGEGPGGLVRFGRVYGPDQATGQGLGYEAACAWLDGPDPPTAVLCSSDILAAGVLQAAHERRLRVPDDLSVVGFDDTLAEYLSPLLTSVRMPSRRLGRAAVGMILDDVAAEAPEPAGEARPEPRPASRPEPPPEPRHVELDAELILRRSTSPPRSR